MQMPESTRVKSHEIHLAADEEETQNASDSTYMEQPTEKWRNSTLCAASNVW